MRIWGVGFEASALALGFRDWMFWACVGLEPQTLNPFAALALGFWLGPCRTRKRSCCFPCQSPTSTLFRGLRSASFEKIGLEGLRGTEFEDLARLDSGSSVLLTRPL